MGQAKGRVFEGDMWHIILCMPKKFFLLPTLTSGFWGKGIGRDHNITVRVLATVKNTVFNTVFPTSFRLPFPNFSHTRVILYIFH